MENEDRWKELAALLLHQRVVVLGYKTRASFVRHLGLMSDRVLHDLENARRDNYDISTLLSLESWYQLTPQQLRAVLGDLYPRHDVVTTHGTTTVQSVRSSRDQTLSELQESIDTMSAMLDRLREKVDGIYNDGEK